MLVPSNEATLLVALALAAERNVFLVVIIGPAGSALALSAALALNLRLRCRRRFGGRGGSRRRLSGDGERDLLVHALVELALLTTLASGSNLAVALGSFDALVITTGDDVAMPVSMTMEVGVAVRVGVGDRQDGPRDQEKMGQMHFENLSVRVLDYGD
jgi:hypothetical protein